MNRNMNSYRSNYDLDERNDSVNSNQPDYHMNDALDQIAERLINDNLGQERGITQEQAAIGADIIKGERIDYEDLGPEHEKTLDATALGFATQEMESRKIESNAQYAAERIMDSHFPGERDRLEEKSAYGNGSIPEELVSLGIEWREDRNGSFKNVNDVRFFNGEDGSWSMMVNCDDRFTLRRVERTLEDMGYEVKIGGRLDSKQKSQLSGAGWNRYPVEPDEDKLAEIKAEADTAAAELQVFDMHKDAVAGILARGRREQENWQERVEDPSIDAGDPPKLLGGEIKEHLDQVDRMLNGYTEIDPRSNADKAQDYQAMVSMPEGEQTLIIGEFLNEKHNSVNHAVSQGIALAYSEGIPRQESRKAMDELLAVNNALSAESKENYSTLIKEALESNDPVKYRETLEQLDWEMEQRKENVEQELESLGYNRENDLTNYSEEASDYSRTEQDLEELLDSAEESGDNYAYELADQIRTLRYAGFEGEEIEEMVNELEQHIRMNQLEPEGNPV